MQLPEQSGAFRLFWCPQRYSCSGDHGPLPIEMPCARPWLACGLPTAPVHGPGTASSQHGPSNDSAIMSKSPVTCHGMCSVD